LNGGRRKGGGRSFPERGDHPLGKNERGLILFPKEKKKAASRRRLFVKKRAKRKKKEERL